MIIKYLKLKFQWENYGMVKYVIKKNINCSLINGKGNMIELNDFNKIIFEGQYLNGELNGVGIEYFHQGLSIIKAHYINGKKL